MNYLIRVIWLAFFLTLSGCLDTGSSSTKSDAPDVGEDTSQIITLNWSPILELEDGSNLQPSEIESYTVHWGRSSSTQAEEILVGDVDSYEFTATKTGDYYFAVSVNTVYGTQSPLSNLVHKEVN